MSKQHPVIMSGFGISNADLFSGPADAVAPSGDYEMSQTRESKKVIIIDSDHNGSHRRDPEFVWKSFLRGNQPIVMDWWSGQEWEPIRRAMGQTRRYASTMELAAMTPFTDLASTTYCLANPGSEYLIYQPAKGKFTVDLKLAVGKFSVEWFSPENDTTSAGEAVAGGAIREFTPPVSVPVLLYLKMAP